MSDPFRLQRFLDAQDREGAYEQALAELRAGEKKTHWIWFVFPQLAALGRSPAAREYGIGSLAEARAYLRNPVLAARLRECVGALLAHRGRSAQEIFGDLDARKLRSSMTLFSRAAPEDPRFRQVLDVYFDGLADGETDRLI